MTDSLLSDYDEAVRYAPLANVSSISAQAPAKGYLSSSKQYWSVEASAETRQIDRIVLDPSSGQFGIVTYRPIHWAIQWDLLFSRILEDIVPPSPSAAATQQEPLPDWWKSVEAQLKEFRSLSWTWDGFHAPPLDLETLERAAALLQSVIDRDTPQPSVVPARKGGTQFEWHTLQWDLEMEFVPDGRVHGYAIHVATGTETELDHMDLATMRAWIRRLSE